MDRRLSELPKMSLREQVVDAIRNAIIQGKFKPGEKIPEKELAEELGVSRTPIREAIRILEQQGLIEIRPKNGTYITSLNWEEARDSLLVRASLEELAVRLALERLSPQEWDELCAQLQCLLDEMCDAVAEGDLITATEVDIKWHTLLVDSAKSRYLSRMWRTMGLPFLIWSPERELYPLAPEKWTVGFNIRHQELLVALRGRDPDECAAAVQSHIQQKLLDLEKSFESLSA